MAFRSRPRRPSALIRSVLKTSLPAVPSLTRSLLKAPLLKVSLLSMSLLGGGCAIAPARDALPMPDAWRATTTATPLAVPSTQAWWQDFGDPTLTALIDDALARNTELASAALRVYGAQLRAGASTQALLPALSGSVSGSASQSPAADNAPASAPAPQWRRSYTGGLNFGWELDLWGKLRDQRSVARWEAEATEEDRLGVALSLSGKVARQYWQLAALDARLNSGEQGIALAERTLALTRTQHRAGAISGLDLTQAEQSLLSQRASLSQLQLQREQARNNFALLFDLPPQRLPNGIERPTLPSADSALPELRPGVPADVLTLRPDLRAAQKRLESSLLNVRIARKNFLPGVSISGGLSTGGPSLSDVLSAPARNLGVGLSLPFLNIGDLVRQPKIARNDYAIAVLGYRESVYRALSEVENALAAVDTQRRQLAWQIEAVGNARRIEHLNGVRYRAGAVSLRTWLDAQDALRQAETALIDARANALQAAADLRIALGGGAG